MIKRYRTVLFFFCLGLFLLVTPSVILYSQGYRWDLEKRRLVKTGAFYFKIWPKQSEVTLNSGLTKKTDFFFGSVFIENLLPQEYSVKVQKKDYLAWTKSLEIQEGMVTRATDITLVPDRLEVSTIASLVENYFFSPDGKKIVLIQTKEDEKQPSWSLKLYSPESQLITHLLDASELSRAEPLLEEISWSLDSQKVLVQTAQKEQRDYFLVDTTTSPAPILKLESLQDGRGPAFHPSNPEIIFFLKSEGKTTSLSLFRLDLEEEKEEIQSLAQGALAFSLSPDSLFWLSDQGQLFKSSPDLSDPSKDFEKLNLENLPIKEKGVYYLYLFNNRLFVQETKKLFFFNPDTQNFDLVNENFNHSSLSPDKKKLALGQDFEIWVFFLEKAFADQDGDGSGGGLFLTRFSQEISDIFWWTNHYLIFRVNERIRIIEIDDRDKIQIWDLAEFLQPRIFFNQRDKKLYILSQGKLLVSQRMF